MTHEPTPLPWVVEYNDGEVSLRGANGDTIADSVDYYPHAISKLDAEFIKRRVNAYDTLATALEANRKVIGSLVAALKYARGSIFENERFADVAAEIDAALALSEIHTQTSDT